jgi:mannan endo-1,4-beta-mannosidase
MFHGKSRTYYAFCLFLFLSLFLHSRPAACFDSERLSPNAFVTRDGARFSVQGQSFYFHGANQYYFFYKSKYMIDDVLNDAAAMGLRVVRTWAFCDGQWHDGHSLQPSPRNYHEKTFQNLDYAIYRAGQLGIRLIFALVNNWDDFGGMNAYVNWSATARTHDDFYSDPETKAIFRDYITYVLNRTNSYTGVRYKDDPTILMWELANEPRIERSRTHELYAWVHEMAAHIKSMDRNHLVSTGSEGDYGSDFELTHKSPYIDVASFHLYPEAWGMNENDSMRYIERHVQQARERLGKPVYCGEYGLHNKGIRDAVYQRWHRHFERLKIDGSMFWLLSGRQDDGTLYPDYDGLTVYYPESPNTVAAMDGHTKHMNSRSSLRQDQTQPSLSWAAMPSQIAGTVILSGAAADDQKMDRVEVNLGGGFRVAEGSRPWRYAWDTTQFIDGRYAIQIRAVDHEGNSTMQEQVVTVKNGGYQLEDWLLQGFKVQDDGFHFIYFLTAENRTGRTETGRFVFRFFLSPEDALVLGTHYENSKVYRGDPQVSGLQPYFGNVWYIDVDMGERSVAPGESIGFKGQIQQAKGGLKSHNDWSSASFRSEVDEVRRVLLLKDGKASGGFGP